MTHESAIFGILYLQSTMIEGNGNREFCTMASRAVSIALSLASFEFKHPDVLRASSPNPISTIRVEFPSSLKVGGIFIHSKSRFTGLPF